MVKGPSGIQCLVATLVPIAILFQFVLVAELQRIEIWKLTGSAVRCETSGSDLMQRSSTGAGKSEANVSSAGVSALSLGFRTRANFSSGGASALSAVIPGGATRANVSSGGASALSAVVPESRPYGAYCETSVIGEKQTWNPRKKVISYALFSADGTGTLATWLSDGIQKQVSGASLYYPDWVIRVHAIGLTDAMIQELLSYSNIAPVEVVRCHTNSILSRSSSAKMISRFLVYDDPTVYHSIIRDVDGRFSPRELMATNQWVGSKYKFHVMRDHKWHSVPIMGGMFGMKRGVLSGGLTMTDLVNNAMKKYPKSPIPGCCAEDQNFLSKFVWPLVKQAAMDHDSQPGRCRGYGSAACTEWPLGPPDYSNNFFVGAGFKEGRFANMTEYKCDLKCVPH